MVGRAAGAHGVLLEHTKRRRRLARVEHRDPAAGGVDELPRARRDAGQPLKKIEGRALGGQQRGGRARHFRDFFARPAPFAVLLAHGKKGDGSHFRDSPPDARRPCRKRPVPFSRLPERLERDVETGDDAVGLHEKHAAGALRRRHRRGRRHVAGSDVLVEGAADDVAVQAGVERLDHDAGRFRTSRWLVALHDDLPRLADRQLERLDAQGGAQVGLDDGHPVEVRGLGLDGHSGDGHLQRLLRFGALLPHFEQHVGGELVGRLIGLPGRLGVVGERAIQSRRPSATARRESSPPATTTTLLPSRTAGTARTAAA